MVRNSGTMGFIKDSLREMITQNYKQIKPLSQPELIAEMAAKTGKSIETINKYLKQSNMTYTEGVTDRNLHGLGSTNIRHIRRSVQDKLPDCEVRAMAEGGVCHGRKKCCRGDGIGGQKLCSVVREIF